MKDRVVANQEESIYEADISSRSTYTQIVFVIYTSFWDTPSTVLMGGFFRKHKKNTANGMFWFWGTTNLASDGEVLYQLTIDGVFMTGPNGFPGNTEVMNISDWTLSVANQGKNVTSRSCVDSGHFGVMMG